MRIESDQADVRREGLQAVAADASARRLPAVIKLFCVVARNDRDSMARAAAVQGLGRMEGEEVVATLGYVATHDESPFVRADAAQALGRQADPARQGDAVASPAAVAPLAQVLQGDRMADVRVAAAESLRQFKDKAAARALLAALNDSSLAVSCKAWESLRYMTGQNMPRQVQPWEDFLASAADPFEQYGKPPPLPRGENQRPQFTKGVMESIRDLFSTDVTEQELQ
jgi:HEAT repeat protein